jgi:hypothetical protein
MMVKKEFTNIASDIVQSHAHNDERQCTPNLFSFPYINCIRL